MPLTLEQLEDIRAECMADDIEIPPEAVAWIGPEAREFFESGGTELPRKPGLEGAEIHAFYEVRKQTVHNSSPEFLMGALGTTLFGQDDAGAETSGAAAEPGTLAELQSRGVDLAEMRALAAADRTALAARLKELGYSKLGHRMQLEKALTDPDVAADGEELLRSLGLAKVWPQFKTDGLTSVARMGEALREDPAGFDKQMALMGIKRVQRRLLVGALRQAVGEAARGGQSKVVLGPAGDGFLTEDEDDFDADEYAAGGALI